jgi:hypothetical protein
MVQARPAIASNASARPAFASHATRPAGRPAVASAAPARPAVAGSTSAGGGESFTDMAAREKREREISMALAGEERRKRHAKEEHQKQLQQRQRQHAATAGVAAAAIAPQQPPALPRAQQQQLPRKDSAEYYNCVICTQLCIEPARLKCNHTEMICKQCVYHDVKARKGAACPQCREPYGREASNNELETDRLAWDIIQRQFPELVADRQRQLAKDAAQIAQEAARREAAQQQRRAGAPAARRAAAAALPPRAADANGRFMM